MLDSRVMSVFVPRCWIWFVFRSLFASFKPLRLMQLIATYTQTKKKVPYNFVLGNPDCNTVPACGPTLVAVGLINHRKMPAAMAVHSRKLWKSVWEIICLHCWSHSPLNGSSYWLPPLLFIFVTPTGLLFTLTICNEMLWCTHIQSNTSLCTVQLHY